MLAAKLLLEISKFQLFKSEYRIFHYSYLLYKYMCISWTNSSSLSSTRPWQDVALVSFFPYVELTLETVARNFVNYSKYRIFPYFYTRFLFFFFDSSTRSNIILVSFFPYVEKELTLATKLLLEISKFQLFKSEYRIFHYSYLLYKYMCISWTNSSSLSSTRT